MLVEVIGKPAMLEQTAEECAELAHACLKLARYYRAENKVYGKSEEEMLDNLAEEMTDVEICIDELLSGFGMFKQHDNWHIKKEYRLQKRLEELDNEKGSATYEFVEMAVKMMEQEPCEDCISRQAALKELKESAEHHANDSREEALLRRDRDIIRALPPVTPQPKTGHWNTYELAQGGINEKWLECSECMWSNALLIPRNYCPNCGCRMEGVE